MEVCRIEYNLEYSLEQNSEQNLYCEGITSELTKTTDFLS